MSKKVTIFVEGKNDIVFLRQLIRKLYNGLELGEDGTIGGIIDMGGHDREHIFKSKFYQSTAKQYHNIVFEDADLKKDNRGLQNVQQLLEKQKQKHQLTFDYFIFPTNQFEEGSLENILLNIVQQPKKEWINCAINYYECLGKNGFDIPDSHGRWNYMTGHLLDDKNLNFADETTWFIDENPYLKPLIDFLNKFFQ
jgi:hypothetical protein